MPLEEEEDQLPYFGLSAKFAELELKTQGSLWLERLHVLALKLCY